MADPPSPTVGVGTITVIGADEQADVAVDLDRWCRLAEAVLDAEQRGGELTLTFVDRAEITDLNREHLGNDAPTDVLSFPLDDHPVDLEATEIPTLLGDIVICPAVAAAQAPAHAGTLDDELALLVVHGVLHVIGHDHAEPDETARMRAREAELLIEHHWHGPVPRGFRQDHADSEASS